jgi:DnaJ-class molecular chaperone
MLTTERPRYMISAAEARRSSPGSGLGVVLARVRIEVPKRLNKKQRESLEEFRRMS